MTTLDSNTRLLAFTAESIAPYEGETRRLSRSRPIIERGQRGTANHRQGQQTGTGPAGAPDRAHHRARRSANAEKAAEPTKPPYTNHVPRNTCVGRRELPAVASQSSGERASRFGRDTGAARAR